MPEIKESTRGKTHDKIRQAIIRLEKNRPKVVKENRKISIEAVAEEAGVSRALIHNEYPDLLDRIRGNVNKSIQTQRDQKNELLKRERSKNSELRQIIAELTESRNELASKNATLALELRRLEAIIGSKNVSVFREKRTEKP